MDDVILPPPQLWTRTFTWLCVVAFAIGGHQSMVLVVIPLYVVQLGGSPLVAGIALFAFSLPSFSSRPVFGHFADSWNLVGVFTIGCLVLGLLSPLYLIPSLAVVFIVNALRATNIIFPALGLWLVNSVAGGFRLVFLIGSAIALASAAISHIWLRPSISSGPASERAAHASRGVVIERGMLLPTALSLTLTLAAGSDCLSAALRPPSGHPEHCLVLRPLGYRESCGATGAGESGRPIWTPLLNRRRVCRPD